MMLFSNFNALGATALRMCLYACVVAVMAFVPGWEAAYLTEGGLYSETSWVELLGYTFILMGVLEFCGELLCAQPQGSAAGLKVCISQGTPVRSAGRYHTGINSGT